MSYDLAVFDPASAPRERVAFAAWFAAQTTWSESHGYADPRVSTPALRAWLSDIAATFPPMNGPLARADDPEDESTLTDYSVGRTLIYAAFAFSQAKAARKRVVELAHQHGLGFFDVSATAAEPVFPTSAPAE